MRHAVSGVLGWLLISIASWITFGCLFSGSELKIFGCANANLSSQNKTPAPKRSDYPSAKTLSSSRRARPHFLPRDDRGGFKGYLRFHCNVPGSAGANGEDGSIGDRQRQSG